MKKIGFIMLAIMSIAIFSCLDDDEGYSLNNQWGGFGMVHGEEDSFVIVLDEDEKGKNEVLQPVAWSSYPDWGDDFENGSRIWVNFTILDEVLNDDKTVNHYLVKVNSFSNILMKGILQLNEENEDSIGNDAIDVQSYWMSDSLLNFKLRYLGYDKIHYLNLVQNEGVPQDENEPIKLELRHNANDDNNSLSYTAFVSFSLNQLRIAGKDSISVEVTSVDYEGESHTFQQVFNYKDLPLPDSMEQ